MQFKQTLVRLVFLVFPYFSFAQTTYLPRDARENDLIERLEIKAIKDSILNFSKTKPYSRKQFIPVIAQHVRNLYPPGESFSFRINSNENKPALSNGDSVQITSRLTGVDQYNCLMALMNNSEWDTSFTYMSRRPVLKRFYRTPSNLYEVNTKNFFLAINPVFQYIVGKEQDNDQHIFLNSRGLTLRGRIMDKIGFAAYITDNQERDPLYVQQRVTEQREVPGAGFYKEFKSTGYDYFDARGYITTRATPFIDIAFGYDKNFIGNGHRSLFLSDYSNSALFLKLNTRIWKFNYQNLFMELNTAHRLNADQLFPKKYAAMHHLDLQITKWLNIGVFEGIIFGRDDHFEFGYLNPVIFYRSIEQQSGSYDNAVAGFDLKANAARKFQFYGQLLLDEFVLDEIKNNNGWWANKFAYQLGAKYIDAFSIDNLDLQVETNRVRPFTYSHRDSVANYTHYNQPLAHPLGANFHEWIGMIRYQPIPRLLLHAKAIYYTQGRDSGNVSYGGNIFLPNVFPYRDKDYGFDVGSGVKTKVAYTSLLASYQLRPNLFIETNAVFRKQTQGTPGGGDTFIIYAGIRWNMHRREFDF